MATQTDQTTEPRVPLSRDRLLQAAIRIADEDRIEALSMRRLARELGVEAMSLYNHVANKDEILSGIVEIVANEVEMPPNQGNWKAEVRQSAISAHDAFLRHRWACPLMMRTTSPIASRMRWMEWLLRTLREAGFSPNLTHHAYHALDSHITGFTLWQVSFPFDTREELLDLAEDFLRKIPADEYPYALEHAEQHLAEPDPNEPSEFEFGLDLILDGLKRMRTAAG